MSAMEEMSEQKTMESHLHTVDAVVIGVYFAFVIAVGIWSSYKSKKESAGDYFLASRNMHWSLVGASLFASNIGSGHFIGLAGSGAATGIGVAGFELSAIFILMILGWLFVPVYMSSGVYTMPEYLQERFGGQRIRIYLSFLALLLYIFTKISADLYAGALFIQLALNKTSPEWLYLSILILLAIAAVFTIAGGLTAVIWTDFVQTILMVVGAFILMVISFNKVGGLENLVREFPYAVAPKRAGNGTCGIPPADYMNLLRSPYPGESDLPWTGMVFGLTINSIWYWCADQVIVQRTLSSKNMSHAKGGCIFAAYLKLLPLWLLVFPGMISRVLFPNTVGCSDPKECFDICGSDKGCTNIAYVKLVIELLPPGMAGMMLAVMMAALMSSLTSIFNSASTIFTIDVWKRIRERPSDGELVIVGRAFVLVLVVISVIWIPVIQSTGNSKLFDYIQSISSFLAPPICTVYLLAMFWKRTNEPGAFWGLMVGLAIGLIRFGLEFGYSIPSCGSDEEDARPWIIIMTVGNIHYLHFSCVLFILTGCVTIMVSLLTEPIPEKCIHRLMFWSRRSEEVRESIEGSKQDKNTFEIQERRPTEPNNCMKAVNRCFGEIKGADSAPPDSSRQEEEESARKAVEFLHEEPFWRHFVNVNAVICMAVTVFFWGFFA